MYIDHFNNKKFKKSLAQCLAHSKCSMNSSFTALTTALSLAPIGEWCASATCPLPEENTSWIKYQMTQVFLPASSCASFKPFRERVCTWEGRLRFHGSGKATLPSTAISPAKDTNHLPLGQIQCPLYWANVGPNSTKLIPYYYVKLISYFKVDNKIHKPLNPQAHMAKDLPFPDLPL